jgi:transcriptional regulator with PAS, ATPase and Fis domain
MFDERKTQDLSHGRRGGTVMALRNLTTAETFVLEPTKRRWLVGSDESCDVRILDAYVSGMHCIIERRDDGTLAVRDRASRNGTYIDGNPIEKAELLAGSYVSIGRSTLLAIASPASGGSESRKAIEQLRGTDPKTRATIDQAIRAAQTDCSVLVVGETGTGKDLIARLVHETSRRSNGPFVPVNCGAIPRELIGSELFGHEKGSFTGASETRDGYFVEAHGGTLFLDEIGELPAELQPTLLRVLETRRVRRIGGQSDRIVDVRIVAATNRVAGLGTDQSPMRVDLFHRISTMVLELAPLRERMGDLVDIVEAVLGEHRLEFGDKRVSSEAWQALSSYPWPGNVRELRHAVARAVALGGRELGPADFFPDFISRVSRLQTEPIDGSMLPYEVMIRGAMKQALQEHGTIRAAATALGMPKSTFADKARSWGLITTRRGRPRRVP